MKTIYSLGVGHNTPVFIDLALSCGYDIAGLYHYNAERNGEIDHGYKIVGSFDNLFSEPTLAGKSFLLTMGDNNIRSELSARIIAKGGSVPTLIHPMAVVSKFARVSAVGVYILPFTFVQADSNVGDNTVLLSHVNISHTTKIGNNCFIAGGSIVGAYTTVEGSVFIGQGILSISSKVKTIGSHAYVGARSLLTHDVPPYAIMAGSPAKIIGFVNQPLVEK